MTDAGGTSAPMRAKADDIIDRAFQASMAEGPNGCPRLNHGSR